MAAVQDVKELRSLLHSCYDIIVESGFIKPLSYAMLEDKTSIVQTVTLHYVVLRSLGELQQFHDVLASLHVANALEHNGELLRAFFTNENKLMKPLTAGMF